MISKATICALVLFLALGCQPEQRIDRAGNIESEFSFHIDPSTATAFVEAALTSGEALRLRRMSDQNTESVFAERTHPAHIKYLVSSKDGRNSLVAYVGNVSRADEFVVQIYSGAVPKPVMDDLLNQLLVIAQKHKAHGTSLTVSVRNGEQQSDRRPNNSFKPKPLRGSA